MKSILVFVAVLVLPITIWAMTPISDSELSDVTGQSGVTIIIDVTMNIQFATIAWGDPDGCEINYKSPVGLDTDVSYLGVKSSKKSKQIVNSSTAGISNDENTFSTALYSYTMRDPIAFEAMSSYHFMPVIPDEDHLRLFLKSLQMPYMPWYSRW